MQNKNGFLVDERGVIRGLEAPISTCKISGLPRRAYHQELTFNRNLQLVQRVGVVTYTADGTKSVTEEIVDIITDIRLQNLQLDKWRESATSFTTEGAFIDGATGGFVDADAPGAVEQLAALQTLTPSKLRAMGMPVNQNGSTPVLHMVYMMLLGEIQKQDSLGRL